MPYLTIENNAVAEFEEKKSVFIGSVKRVFSEEEAKEFIADIRNKYKDARHNVFSYIIGENKNIQRYSDDGEPQGTGGIPILETIKKNDLTDLVIVVTRYFGGILLGTGGLSRAYSKAASMAIKEAGIVEKVRGFELEIQINYDLLGKIQYLCNEKAYNVESIEYTDKVKLKIYCERNLEKAIEEEMLEVSSGSAVITIIDDKLFYKNNNKLIVA